MKRAVSTLTTVLIATVLAASAVGSAVAEPGKNQIRADASCIDGQTRETYTFVLNGMGKAWQLEETNSNLQVKRYKLTYFAPGSDPATAEPIGFDVYGGGEKNGQRDELITCEGKTTTVLEGIGEVTVVAEFEAFVTPRGSA